MIFSFFKKKKNNEQKDGLKESEDTRKGMAVTAIAAGHNDESLEEIIPEIDRSADDELKDLVFEYSFAASSLYSMYEEWHEKQPESSRGSLLDIYSFINLFISNVLYEPEFKQSPNKLGVEYANLLIDYLDDFNAEKEDSAEQALVAEQPEDSSNDEASEEASEKEDDLITLSDLSSVRIVRFSDLKESPCAFIFVSEDKLRAYLVLLPKRKNSLTPTYDRVLNIIHEAGIKEGIDTALLKRITSKKKYFQIFLIAKGSDKENGVDGQVIEHYPRKIKIVLKEDEFGNTDFKNLGNVKNISKGSVICDIVLPTNGTPGITIYGEKIPCADGEMPIIPMGENTNLTDDELHLVASCDGCVNYHDGMFYVRQLLYIKGNVDPHTGNISFKGDVIIEGDVMEGYNVQADGNLRIQGTVENSSLTAGGGISITGGVKGNEKAVLTSGSEIKSLFLESCTVKAKNGVYAESIINSSIYTDDCVSVDRGKGIILGSTFIARNYVQAKAIGNQSGRVCTIKLGTNYNIAEEKMNLTKELDELEKGLRAIKKDLLFFERGQGLMTSEKQAQYSALKSKAGLYANQIRIKQKKLTEIINNGFDISECFIRARECFPPINLTIGTHNTIIRMPYFSSKCYFSTHKEEFRIVNFDDPTGPNTKGSK